MMVSTGTTRAPAGNAMPRSVLPWASVAVAPASVNVVTEKTAVAEQSLIITVEPFAIVSVVALSTVTSAVELASDALVVKLGDSMREVRTARMSLPPFGETIAVSTVGVHAVALVASKPCTGAAKFHSRPVGLASALVSGSV